MYRIHRWLHTWYRKLTYFGFIHCAAPCNPSKAFAAPIRPVHNKCVQALTPRRNIAVPHCHSQRSMPHCHCALPLQLCQDEHMRLIQQLHRSIAAHDGCILQTHLPDFSHLPFAYAYESPGAGRAYVNVFSISSAARSQVLQPRNCHISPKRSQTYHIAVLATKVCAHPACWLIQSAVQHLC